MLHHCLLRKRFVFLQALWKESLRWLFKNGRRSGVKRCFDSQTNAGKQLKKSPDVSIEAMLTEEEYRLELKSLQEEWGKKPSVSKTKENMDRTFIEGNG